MIRDIANYLIEHSGGSHNGRKCSRRPALPGFLGYLPLHGLKLQKGFAAPHIFQILPLSFIVLRHFTAITQVFHSFFKKRKAKRSISSHHFWFAIGIVHYLPAFRKIYRINEASGYLKPAKLQTEFSKV
jgi:hypothetical protein